jgi:FKBP-type peptidyl-prolyl cis-trans isomerase FklB
MKKTIILGTAGLLTLSACVSKKHHIELIEKHNKVEQELTTLKQEKIKIQTVNLENEIDKVSYSLGVSVAENIKQQGLNQINTGAFAKAVEDVYAGGETKINGAEANQILQTYFQAKQESQHSGSKEIGEKFLAENSTKDGVVVLPSGLQYIVLKEGAGEKPTAASTVKTHYHGTLIDGTVFDSSVDRGEPISFPVGGVIAGWTEALQLMAVGSKWKLFIPYNLAYGERGAGGKIGPFSALVFEVELLGIE